QEAEVRKKKQAEFQALVNKGRQALAARRYDEALQAFADADRLLPGDPSLAALKKDAEKGKADTKAAQDAEAKKKEKEKRQRAEDQRLMTAAQTAMAGRRYDEAIKDYTAALKLMPGDAAATKALADAHKAMEAAKVPPPPPKANPQEEAAKWLQNGAAL